MTNTNSDYEQRFLPEVDAVLRQAGWYRSRKLEKSRLDQWYVIPWIEAYGYCRIFPAALRFLAEFGDLRVGQNGPGITCARKSIILNPLAAIGFQDESWISFEWLLETSLFPIGLIPDGEVVIMLDLQGRVWGMWEDLGLIGNSIDEALTNLIRGISSDEGFHMFDHRERLKPVDKIEEIVAQIYSLKRDMESA